MKIKKAIWGNPEKTYIMARIDGVLSSIPADANNLHYAFILENGTKIAEYKKPKPTQHDVEDEKERRRAKRLGAKDKRQADLMALKNLTEEVAILRKRVDGTMTTADTTRQDELLKIQADLQALDVVEEQLKKDRPDDYDDSKYWDDGAKSGGLVETIKDAAKAVLGIVVEQPEEAQPEIKIAPPEEPDEEEISEEPDEEEPTK